MKQNAGIGFCLALTTAICWGALPIAMKQVLVAMEPYTIVWYRFLIASAGLGIFLYSKGALPKLKMFDHQRWWILLLVATGGLLGNFVLFSSSLQYLSPTASQVIGQLSTVGLMVASVVILKEKMRLNQVIGAVVLICGLLMFFNSSLVELFTRLTDYTFGILLGVAASTVWVAYGVVQKVLLRRLTSQQLLFLLYTLCVLFITPLAKPEVVFQLTGWQLACLLFCGANTLVGYGALAEAMARWQAAQVSTIITLTPLFTLFFSDLLSLAWPSLFAAPSLNLLGYVGSFVVVAGAMFAAIGHRLIAAKRSKYPQV
ncbi:DMT family transporter [Dickeya chrysanthemi]|uniref:DMT family transporter n=1 Tax=Dickeya chrysanthemi TaxID=556 RepID=UPI0003A853BF|nr:DMT family transporter [Dickeya chrysanthemi]